MTDELIIDDHLFTIKSSNGDIAYADDENGAYAAYWQLHRDSTYLQVKITIINNVTGKVVWED